MFPSGFALYRFGIFFNIARISIRLHLGFGYFVLWSSERASCRGVSDLSL